MRPSIRPLLYPVCATVATHLLFLAIYLRPYHGDASALICLSDRRIGSFPYEAVTVSCGPGGHDGQFCYSLARNPWSRHGRDIDVPSVRHLRIFYPAACWILSVSDPRLLIYVMPLVNMLAIAALAALGACFALRHGRSAWWGFVLPIGVNAGLSLMHDFADCVSTLAIFAMLAAWLRNGRGSTIVLWAAVAVFAREQNVAVVGLIGIFARWRRPGIAAGLFGVGVLWVAWLGVLKLCYGDSPIIHNGSNFSFPFAGLIYRFQHLGDTGIRISRRLGIIHLLSTLHLISLIGAGACVLLWRRSLEVSCVLAAGIVLAVMGGSWIYNDYMSYLRVFVWLPLGLWMLSIEAGKTWPLVLLTPGVLWCLLGAMHWV